nr:MAG TPA: Protein of unknown function (DUF2672) [Siphoviridae sp. ctEup56]
MPSKSYYIITKDKIISNVNKNEEVNQMYV